MYIKTPVFALVGIHLNLNLCCNVDKTYIVKNKLCKLRFDGIVWRTSIVNTTWKSVK